MKLGFIQVWIFAILSLGFPMVGFSQQPSVNLVPNPSFEEVISSGFDCPGFVNENNTWNPPYPYFDWTKVQDWENPDGTGDWNPNGYNRWLSAFCNPDLPFEARTGTAWGQNQIYGNTTTQNNRFGYFCSPISPGLIPGHYYYVSFYTRWSNGLTGGYGNQWGAVFSNDKVHQTFDHVIDNVTPEVSEVTASNSYDFTWHRTHGIFQATSWNDWINLGAFDHNTVINSWYALDDITVIDLGEDACASQWLIENTVYDHTQEIFEAEDKIEAGFNVGFNDLDGPVNVIPTSDVTYKAGNYIALKPGFSAQPESFFHAYIAPCGIYCPGGANYSTNISTGNGVNQSEEDLKWSYAFSPTVNYSPNNDPLKSVVIDNPFSWIQPDNTDYNWINPGGNDDYLYDDGYHGYELSFNVPDASLIEYFEIQIDRMAVDNSLEFYLNGQILDCPILQAPGTNTNYFSQLYGPLTINHTPYLYQPLTNFLQTGDNKLLVKIYTKNTSGGDASRTGLLLKANFNYTSCSSEQITIVEGRSMSADDPSNEKINENMLSLSPNPNDGNFSLFIESDKERNATVQLTDISGHIFYTHYISVIEGLNQFEISKPELPSGVYFLKVDGFDEQLKMIITK